MTQSTPRVWLILPLDVTNEAQVKSVFVQAKDTFGHVDVVYNNAAQVFYQELEGIPMDRARALMDVNFWGAGTVSFEAVRFFREENLKGAGGMLVQVSSITGIMAVHLALDSFTEVLAQKVLPACNIRFVNVHPCWTRTPIVSSEMLEPPAVYASEPTAVTTKTRAGWDASMASDALIGVEDGFGLVNMYTGIDSLERVHAKIGRLQGEMMWNTKVHYEY
ncbi:hypothetical protein DFH29DRAFT_1003532 [Suillus ampliporus]|nr:hypothetical protein DFH29DRAFT_1003532 [Suillus ampliporus]